MLPEKICMLPWISIETSPIGTARPCCLAVDEIIKPDGTKYSLRENTLEEIYHSDQKPVVVVGMKKPRVE